MNWDETRGLTWFRCGWCFWRFHSKDGSGPGDGIRRCPNCGHTKFSVEPRDDDSYVDHYVRRAVTRLALVVGIIILGLAVALLR